MTMEVERIDSQTVVIHLPEAVELEDTPALNKLMLYLYDEGVQFIKVDFIVTKILYKSCLGVMLLFHKKLTDRGGELKFVNLKNERLKHTYRMFELHRFISIEEIDGD